MNMKKKTLAAGTTLAAFVLAAAALAAATAPEQHEGEGQDVDQLIELMRKDVRAEKADIVAKTMELDAEEAARFWPVYKEYEAERKTLGDERLAIIKDYADHVDTLTDEKARDLITRSIALDGREHALKTQYLDKFLAVLPAKTAARFFQVEARINNLIDLELSSQIPLAY